MWRAYASKNGVAFVFKHGPFVAETDALNAFTSPVAYETPTSFHDRFAAVVTGMEANLARFQAAGGAFFHDLIQVAFRFAMQATKHPAFREEREWRVIYSPTIVERLGKMSDEQKRRVPTEIMALNGVPQRVYAIPFQNYPDEGFVGATVPELIDRILIGPTSDAYAIRQAFIAELRALGVAEPNVEITGVPLRQV
jgi:hypothetical protein